ncbi:MAG: 2-amino-4-hydroxy-6-hydroxymethyldihydropteridine diphosphokinase [candidate division Zixibacteria bacterium]|nr:2-amino-4-hydroxy-6-hydroxymethyldihydropteridine diphosphokinase [candidate division Zixibacteria bacterium]
MNERIRKTVYLSLGSNLGDRYTNIMRAISKIQRIPDVDLRSIAPLYETEPVGATEHPVYLNTALRMETQLTPVELLDRCQEIEAELGRVNKGELQPRMIDIDILLYDDLILEQPELRIPHPRIKERIFVLKLLTDLEPELKCPVTEHKYSQLLESEHANQRIELFRRGVN